MSDVKKGDDIRFVKLMEAVFAEIKGTPMTPEQERIKEGLNNVIEPEDCTLDNVRAIIDGTNVS